MTLNRAREKREGLNRRYREMEHVTDSKLSLFVMLNWFGSRSSLSKRRILSETSYLANRLWYWEGGDCACSTVSWLGLLSFAIRGSCHFVIIVGYCMRIKLNLSPYWVIQKVWERRSSARRACSWLLSYWGFARKFILGRMDGGWNGNWSLEMETHEDSLGQRGQSNNTHSCTQWHKPCMVARGLLPMRAWFIPVLTPIIVFLKCGWTANSHTHPDIHWCTETFFRLNNIKRAFVCVGSQSSTSR